MAAKRKPVKYLLECCAGLTIIFLIVIGDLMFFYYHGVFYRFLGVWLVIIASSFSYIAGSSTLIELRQNPNTTKPYKTASIVKLLITLLSIFLLIFVVVAAILIISFVAGLIISGNIAKPIYDLMFVSVLIMYVMATTYGIWWGKKRYL